MKGFDLGYIVGLFEGEGFIAFNYSFRKGKSQREYYTVHVGIVNTNKEILERIKFVVGYGNITEKKVGKNHRPCWNWRVSKQVDVVDFLVMTYPYLIEKQEKAKLVLQFLESRLACNPNAKANCQRKYTEEERQFYKRYRNLECFRASKKEA